MKKFCFVGHVDTGKSTCCGRLLSLVGALDEHTLNTALADDSPQRWSKIFDIFTEEQARGKTHEYNEIRFSADGQEYTIIDCPGHNRFISSMIEGINHDSSNLIGCLVVSAIPNEFESGWTKGQTKEDIIIVRGSGIEDLIVLINKMDHPLVKWDQNLYNTHRDTLDTFIGKCRFRSVIYIPISAYTGANLVENIGDGWYSGPSVMDSINAISPMFAQVDTKNYHGMSSYKLKCLVTLFEVPELITSGYEWTIHYYGKYYPMTIEYVKPNIVKRPCKGLVCVMSCIVPIQLGTDNKFIVRKNTWTLGFGTITGVKQI